MQFSTNQFAIRLRLGAKGKRYFVTNTHGESIAWGFSPFRFPYNVNFCTVLCVKVNIISLSVDILIAVDKFTLIQGKKFHFERIVG